MNEKPRNGGGLEVRLGKGRGSKRGQAYPLTKLNPLQNQVKVPYLLLQFAGQREL